MNTLPIELLHLISQVDPTTYNLLYQCSKLFHQNEDKMMDLFTQTYVYYDIKGDETYTFTALPNKSLHSINDYPAFINRRAIFTTTKVVTITACIWDITNMYNDVLCMTWYKQGKKHRDNDRPAYIEYICGYEDEEESMQLVTNLLTNKESYNKLCYVNPIGATNIIYSVDAINYSKQLNNNLGEIHNLIWYKHDKIHRDNDQPARYMLFNSHEMFLEWYQSGEIYRYGNYPCTIEIYPTCYVKQWMHEDGSINGAFDDPLRRYKNGVLHADNDQPAFIDDTHGIYIWYQNGLVHRDNNQPAMIKTKPDPLGWGSEYLPDNSNNIIERYYTHGSEYRV
jgi:hypothetical protein